MDKKTFVTRHPGIKGRLKELIDNPFTIIDETQIDKIKLKEVIKIIMRRLYIENAITQDDISFVDELKKELRLE